MSYADQVFIQNCKDILSKGVWDTGRPVRPKWEDGTPAHTIKLFGVVNRYDLKKESLSPSAGSTSSRRWTSSSGSGRRSPTISMT